MICIFLLYFTIQSLLCLYCSSVYSHRNDYKERRALMESIFFVERFHTKCYAREIINIFLRLNVILFFLDNPVSVDPLWHFSPKILRAKTDFCSQESQLTKIIIADRKVSPGKNSVKISSILKVPQ